MKVLSRDHGAGPVCHLGTFFQGYLLRRESVRFAATASYVVSVLAVAEICVCFGAGCSAWNSEEMSLRPSWRWERGLFLRPRCCGVQPSVHVARGNQWHTELLNRN